MSWRLFDALLLLAMVVLWAASAFTGLISSTTFIGHVSMLALRRYHPGHEKSDKPAATGDRYTLPSGVKVGGRGAEAIAKHPAAFAKRQSS